MHPLITSHQNPKIKNILALEKARERKLQNVFVIEGLKELSLAVEGKYAVSSVFYCPEIVDVSDIQSIIRQENLLIPVQQSVFEKIAYRESSGGVVAVAEQKKHPLENIRLRKNPLVLVLESVEKPGILVLSYALPMLPILMPSLYAILKRTFIIPTSFDRA